jgi:hypothetical protein
MVLGMDTVIFMLKWIASLGVAAAFVVSTAYAALRFLSKKWLDAYFAERLEKFKHAQNQEIERLRYRINALMDRTTKLHQLEFEVLPQLWEKLGIAFQAASSFTSRIVSYPDLDQMGDEQFFEFVANSNLLDWKKMLCGKAAKRPCRPFKPRWSVSRKRTLGRRMRTTGTCKSGPEC